MAPVPSTPKKDVGLGLVPDWPPQDPPIEVRDGIDEEIEWPATVQIVIGIRTTEPISGLRGILVRWRDGNEVETSKVFDSAVVTCAPDACNGAEAHSRSGYWKSSGSTSLDDPGRPTDERLRLSPS